MEKTCSNGHTFFKTSASPVCPICEQVRTHVADFELISYHGFGPSSIDIVRRLVI